MGTGRGRRSNETASRTGSPVDAASRCLGVLLVALAIAASALVRWRVADVPFERDEGEYAYSGQLILEGQPPYRLAYNMKFPGTYYAYAGFLATFGSSPRGVRTGLLFVNAASIFLVYLVGRRLLGGASAGVAALAFALLSLDRWIMGVFAHATHFVVAAVLLGLWLLLRALDRGRWPAVAAAGSLFGIAVLMKQHAIFFIAAAATLVLWHGVRERGDEWSAAATRAGVFVAGGAAPILCLVALFAAQGVLGAFWFWTFRYASAYVTAIPLSSGFETLSVGFKSVTAHTLGFWILAALGTAALWLAAWPRPARMILTGLLVASFLSTCPGFYFREHYFIVMLPAVSLLVGVAVVSLVRWIVRLGSPLAGAIAGAAILAGVVGLYVIPEREYLFRMGPRQLSRERYGSNPFVESEEIARYIREHTSQGDRIAVLGSEPQIYFYSGRTSASGYIYMYPLMEDQPFAAKMQDEMIRQIEDAQPAFVVFAKIGASWLARKQSDPRVLRWGDQFVRTCYEMVGIADIHSKNVTTYVWDEQAPSYSPVSQNLVYVFRRKAGGDCRVGSR